MKKYHRLFAVIFVLTFLMGGCGRAKYFNSTETSSAPAMSQSQESASTYDAAAGWAEEAPAAEEIAETEEGSYDDSGVTSTTGIDNVEATGQKLIKTVGMTMETKEFDTLLENIRLQVEEIGGYIESSDISGSSYYNTWNTRYAWLKLRIPADKLDGFVTIVSEMGNVTNKNESVQDITLQYVDVESHKAALATEQQRLLELLEQAESMEDIIAIESRLSEVRYELQSYESTLRTYDNQVNYSTVSIDINEVERETKVPEKRNFFEEIQYRLSDNFYSIGQGIREFTIWFISSLPYLVIWAVAIFIFVRLIRKIFWKKPFFKKRKKDENRDKEQNKN